MLLFHHLANELRLKYCNALVQRSPETSRISGKQDELRNCNDNLEQDLQRFRSGSVAC
jgi:hypothetical protein